MLKNHIKIAWRNLIKQKALFSINIIGLSIGIATCLTILLFVMDELSYDRYNEHADRIVRVVLKGKVSDEFIKEAFTPAPVAATLEMELPEVVKGTRLRPSGIPKITYGTKTFRSSKLAFVDPNFFEVFTLPLIKGDVANALSEPNSIVITKEQATKYFGEEDPLGKVLNFNENSQAYKVTGVIDKVPDNSHFHFDLFASMAGEKDTNELNWIQSNGDYTYLLLKEPQSYKRLEPKLAQFVEKYMGPQLQLALGISYKEFSESGNNVGLFLQPLTDIHLRSDLTSSSELEQGGDIRTLYIFSAVALFVLIIACINFMNLSTAAASKRAKEIGVKKTLGSSKGQLVAQFLTESTIVSILSMILALLLVALCLPYFNSLSDKTLQLGQFLTPQLLIYLLLFGIFISMLAGSYPAFVLSSLKAITAMRSKLTNRGGQSKGIRSGLVVFQFSVSVTLIIATLIADQQMSFMLNKDLGYDKDQIIVLRESGLLGNQEAAFKDKLNNDSRVEHVTRSGFIPAGQTNRGMFNIYPDPQSDVFRRTFVYRIDHQYIETLGMKLISGRDFSDNPANENSNVIINETSARTFGIEDDPIGQTIVMGTDDGKLDLVVIGVVRDFHFNSLYQPIEPLIMLHEPNPGLIIRASGSDISGLISSIKVLWDDFNKEEPLNYSLLDESYNRIYLVEQKLRTLIRIFAYLTICVACLGLLGLVTFTTEQKLKEIGIRKVLGSTVTQIVSMLSFDFLKLVVISFVIAFPLGFYLMSKWLENFAYRIEIHWDVFLLAGLGTILIAFATLSFKSIKAALANPVNSLRTE